MKTITVFLLLAITLCGCGDDNDIPPLLRSSDSFNTNEMNAYISAESHTHVDRSNGEEETHTTVAIEYYAYDPEGYYSNIELSENDRLSIAVAGESFPVTGVPFPSSADKIFVEYLEDIDIVTPGTRVSVNLDRQRDAGTIETAFTLPDNTEITVTPSQDTPITLADEITLSWQALDNTDYMVRVAFYCENTDGSLYTQHVHVPCQSSTFEQPFRFSPNQYFTVPASTSAANCRVHSSLMSNSSVAPPADTPYRSAIIRVYRENIIKHLISG